MEAQELCPANTSAADTFGQQVAIGGGRIFVHAQAYPEGTLVGGVYLFVEDEFGIYQQTDVLGRMSGVLEVNSAWPWRR